MKAKEVRNMSIQELREKLKTSGREMYQARSKFQTGRSETPGTIRGLRKDMARILTILNEKKLDAKIKTYIDQVYSAKLTAGLWFEFIPAATMQLIPKLYQEVLIGQKTPREAAAAFDKAAKDAAQQ